MLKYRLFFGTVMTIFFVGAMLFDGWLDGSLGSGPRHEIQGTILCIFIAVLAIPAQLEMSKLAARTGHTIFTPVIIPASILIATAWYWSQWIRRLDINILLICAMAVSAVYFYQAFKAGTKGVIANCGASLLSFLYLGLLSAFVLGIRIDFGVLPLLMFVLCVKIADIGAYATGSMIGKHKFSPRISPGKTWEGLFGAMLISAVAGAIFAEYSGIMRMAYGAIFGLIFAFIGQLGDLAESMLKRDAEAKDSSHAVPGFGGILDVIDSPLIAAPFAYMYFWAAIR